MAIGAKQLSLDELAKLYGPQPAAYSGQTRHARGQRQIRVDRRIAGVHPCGIAPVDRDKQDAGHACRDCAFRQVRDYGTKSWSVCTLATRRIDRQTGYTKHAHKVLQRDPPCTLHKTKGSVDDAPVPEESGVPGDVPA